MAYRGMCVCLYAQTESCSLTFSSDSLVMRFVMQVQQWTCFRLLCGSHSLQQEDPDQCPALVSMFKQHLCAVD